MVWNRGDYRCKLVTLALTSTIQKAVPELSGTVSGTLLGSLASLGSAAGSASMDILDAAPYGGAEAGPE